MAQSTEIRNRQHIRQVKSFEGLRWGTGSPTDIDAFIDFNNKVFIFVEAKRGAAALPRGQSLALERLCDACGTPERYCIVFNVQHDQAEDDIRLGECEVGRYYHNKKWSTPKTKINLKDAIDSVRKYRGLS
jgi:hypothetical protein